MKQPNAECKFKVDDYVETTWGANVHSEKGYRGQVTDTQWHPKKGWRVYVNFNATMQNNLRVDQSNVRMHEDCLRLVSTKKTYLWYEVIAQHFKRWFSK